MRNIFSVRRGLIGHVATVSRDDREVDTSRREIHRRNIFAVHLFFSLRRGSGESRRTDLGSISVGPRPGSDRLPGRRGSGRTGRIYVFGEGQGNEGSDKCSERAEDSWMQRAGKTGRKGECRGGRMHLRVARRKRVIETNSIPRIVSNGEGATRRAVFGTRGIRGIPNSRKATIGGTRNP